MTVKLQTLQLIQEAHGKGLLDADIAQHAGVSLATVKRGRIQLGLATHYPNALRGRLGEQLVAQAAEQQGLEVQWRPFDNAPYDLGIQGRRVDVKATTLRPDGSLKFRCPLNRTSFFGQYEYPKNLAKDCDVVALTGLTSDQHLACLYLLPSELMPPDLTIRPGSKFEQYLDNWALFDTPHESKPLQA